MKSSIALNTCHCCAIVTTIPLQSFSSCNTETPSPLHINSPFPAPSSHHLLSVSMNVTPLVTSFKRNHSICPFASIWLTLFSIMFSKVIHIVAYVRILFSWIRPHLVCLFTHQCHLRCFHLLCFVNNATINIAVQRPVQVPTFNSFGYILSPTHVGSHCQLHFLGILSISLLPPLIFLCNSRGFLLSLLHLTSPILNNNFWVLEECQSWFGSRGQVGVDGHSAIWFSPSCYTWADWE